MKKLSTYYKNLKFRNKLFISYIITIIIPVLILGAYSYYQSKTFLLDQATNGLYDSIKQGSDKINYRIERYNGLMDIIAYNKRVKQILNNNYRYYSILFVDIIEQIDPLFNNVLNQNDDVSDISIYTGNNVPEYGSFIISLDRIEKEQWYTSLNEGGLTKWFKTESEIFGARKVYNEFTESFDVVYIKINKEKLFTNLDFIANSKYATFIFNNENDVIYEENMMPEVLQDTSAGKISSLKPGIVKINGESLMLVKGEIPEAGWNINYLVPIKAITLSAKAFVSITVIIIFSCLVLLMILSWIFSNAFVKRLHDLNKKIHLVQKGDMQVEIQSPYTDEIGELTTSFGTMLDNINHLISEVYQSKIIQKEAELKVLQAQINPHFLYNTLSIINWKAIEIDAEEISQLTVNVSNFYRSVLNRGKNLILLKNEIQNMKIYIDIQLIMHNNSFDVVYDIDEEILEYETINIILQPIVENAIVHGIEKKETGRGLLKISGRQIEDNIKITVEDNGVGMEASAEEAVLTESTKGYGIKNVNDRIKIFFGQQYGIHILSTPGVGTTVEITVPKYSHAGTEQETQHSR